MESSAISEYIEGPTRVQVLMHTQKKIEGTHNDKVSEIKSHLFEKINKTDKSLARMMKKWRIIKLLKSRMKELTVPLTLRSKEDYKGIFEQWYAKKLKKLRWTNSQKGKTTEANSRTNRKSEQTVMTLNCN